MKRKLQISDSNVQSHEKKHIVRDKEWFVRGVAGSVQSAASKLLEAAKLLQANNAAKTSEDANMDESTCSYCLANPNSDKVSQCNKCERCGAMACTQCLQPCTACLSTVCRICSFIRYDLGHEELSRCLSCAD